VVILTAFDADSGLEFSILWGAGVAMADPTGEATSGALRLDFHRRLLL
jgi:hypothetical protein